LLQLGEMAVRVADRVGAVILGDFADKSSRLGLRPAPSPDAASMMIFPRRDR